MVIIAGGLVSGVIGGLVFGGIVEVTLLVVCMLERICSGCGVTGVDSSDCPDRDACCVTFVSRFGWAPSGNNVGPPLDAAEPLEVGEAPAPAGAVVVSSPRIGPAAAWRSLVGFTSVGICSVKRNSCSMA